MYRYRALSVFFAYLGVAKKKSTGRELYPIISFTILDARWLYIRIEYKLI